MLDAIGFTPLDLFERVAVVASPGIADVLRLPASTVTRVEFE